MNFTTKVTFDLDGEEGNVFAVIAKATSVLRVELTARGVDDDETIEKIVAHVTQVSYERETYEDVLVWLGNVLFLNRIDSNLPVTFRVAE